MASIMSMSGFKVLQWMWKYKACSFGEITLGCSDERWLNHAHTVVFLLRDVWQSAFSNCWLLPAPHWYDHPEASHACLDCEVTVMREVQVSIITADMGHWSGLEVSLFQRTEVCVACHRGGKSKPRASQTRVTLVMPGKSACSLVVEQSSFPSLHGTLVKVGGHFIQRSEECEACHKHKIPLTTPHLPPCCLWAAMLEVEGTANRHDWWGNYWCSCVACVT